MHLVFVRITVICGARTWQTRLSKRFFFSSLSLSLSLLFFPFFFSSFFFTFYWTHRSGGNSSGDSGPAFAIARHDDAPPAITFRNSPTTNLSPPFATRLASISARYRRRSHRNPWRGSSAENREKSPLCRILRSRKIPPSLLHHRAFYHDIMLHSCLNKFYDFRTRTGWVRHLLSQREWHGNFRQLLS